MREKSKPHLLFVGAFPPSSKKVFGGNVTDCRILLQSSFPKRIDLDLIDSTQASIPAPPFIIRLMLAARRFMIFIFRFERRKPDAVLLFSGSGAGLVEKGLMGWYARLRKGRVFLFPRGGGLLRSYAAKKKVPAWVKMMFHSAERVLCQGSSWQDYVINGLGRLRQDAPVIPNWTATPRLLDIGRERSVETHMRPVRLLFVGWVEHEKGIMELLAAVNALRAEYSIQLDIVGNGSAFTAANSLVEENGLQSVVTFSSWRSGEELEDRFRRCDVFVLPSWAEGLPNAMIEAMAAGMCVVATTVGNIPDTIADGENGLLVPPKDSRALESALGKVVSDAGLRSRLAKNAHEKAKRDFAVEQAVDNLIQAMFAQVKEVDIAAGYPEGDFSGAASLHPQSGKRE